MASEIIRGVKVLTILTSARPVPYSLNYLYPSKSILVNSSSKHITVPGNKVESVGLWFSILRLASIYRIEPFPLEEEPKDIRWHLYGSILAINKVHTDLQINSIIF